MRFLYHNKLSVFVSLPSRSCVVYSYYQAETVNVRFKMFHNNVTHTHHISSCLFHQIISFCVRTALSAEWQPADGSKWVEKDFEKDIQKLEKEAEERLDKKIAELKENIATVGKP